MRTVCILLAGGKSTRTRKVIDKNKLVVPIAVDVGVTTAIREQYTRLSRVCDNVIIFVSDDEAVIEEAKRVVCRKKDLVMFDYAMEGNGAFVEAISRIVNADVIMFVNSDDIHDQSVYSEVVKMFIKNKNVDAVITLKEEHDVKIKTKKSVYEVVGGAVKAMIEKPDEETAAKYSYIATGVFAFRTEKLRLFSAERNDNTGEYELSDFVRYFIDNGLEIGYVIVDSWLDIGNPNVLEKVMVR